MLASACSRALATRAGCVLRGSLWLKSPRTTVRSIRALNRNRRQFRNVRWSSHSCWLPPNRGVFEDAQGMQTPNIRRRPSSVVVTPLTIRPSGVNVSSVFTSDHELRDQSRTFFALFRSATKLPIPASIICPWSGNEAANASVKQIRSAPAAAKVERMSPSRLEPGGAHSKFHVSTLTDGD